MDFILELILEIILEGTLEFGMSKKVPLFVRILLLLVLLLICGAMIGVIAMAGIEVWQSGNIGASVMIFVIDVAFVVLCVYALRKKYIENYKNSDKTETK